MLQLEFAILDGIQSIRTAFGDWVMPQISFLGNFGWIWLALAGVCCIFPKYRRLGITMLIALLLDFLLCNLLLKPLVARTRPFLVNTDISLLIPPPTDDSFPSGHTAAAFSAAFALLFGRRNKLWIPAMLLAMLIGFSRLYLYVHYPSDVLAGILIGLILGFVSNRIYSLGKLFLPKRERRSIE